jgi:hypothetical protein
MELVTHEDAEQPDTSQNGVLTTNKPKAVDAAPFSMSALMMMAQVHLQVRGSIL